MGLTEDDLKQQEAMTPEVEALVAKAKEEAKRAGEARKAQAPWITVLPAKLPARAAVESSVFNSFTI